MALLGQELLLVSLEGDLIPRLVVRSFLNDCKCAFANYLIDFEVKLEVEYWILLLPFQHLNQLNELIPRLVLIGYLLHNFPALLRRRVDILLFILEYG